MDLCFGVVLDLCLGIVLGLFEVCFGGCFHRLFWIGFGFVLDFLGVVLDLFGGGVGCVGFVLRLFLVCFEVVLGLFWGLFWI